MSYFLFLKIRVIGNYTQTDVYNKRDDFEFRFFNFHWFRSVVPRSCPSHCISISQLFRFAWCCTSGSDCHSKNRQITSKLLTHWVADTTSFGKVLQIILGTSVQICYNIVCRMCFKEITHTVFCGDLIYRWRRVSNFHLVALENSKKAATSTVWPSGNREEDRPCVWYFFNLPEALHSDLQVDGYYIIDLVQTSSDAHSPDPRPFWLLNEILLDLGPDLAYSWEEHKLL